MKNSHPNPPPFNIMVFALLSDQKLKATLLPLIKNDQINRIFLIRRHPLKSDKIINVCPPSFIRNILVFSEPYRLLSGIIIALFFKIHFVIGIFYRLHSVYSSIVGQLFNIKTVFLIIENPKLYETDKKYLFRLSKCHRIGVRGTQSEKYLIDRGIQKDRIFIPPVIIDIELPLNETKKEYDLIFIGNLIQTKRPELFIEIVEKLKNSKKDIKAVILGDGEMMNILKGEISNRNLRDNIFLEGHVDNVDDYIKKSKLLIMTSESEGLPMAIIETMRYGIPVIVPNIGDIPDIAVHDYNAKVLNSLNIEIYAKESLELLENKEKYEALSVNALNTMKKKRIEYSLEAGRKLWNETLMN